MLGRVFAVNELREVFLKRKIEMAVDPSFVVNYLHGCCNRRWQRLGLGWCRASGGAVLFGAGDNNQPEIQKVLVHQTNLNTAIVKTSKVINNSNVGVEEHFDLFPLGRE